MSVRYVRGEIQDSPSRRTGQVVRMSGGQVSGSPRHQAPTLRPTVAVKLERLASHPSHRAPDRLLIVVEFFRQLGHRLGRLSHGETNAVGQAGARDDLWSGVLKAEGPDRDGVGPGLELEAERVGLARQVVGLDVHERDGGAILDVPIALGAPDDARAVTAESSAERSAGSSVLG